MALQNKVLPNGDIVATTMRGTFMGNRGGRIHFPETKTLHPTRRWASRQWICCMTSFKERHRAVMGKGYTELFFLDEVTALSAGHRPCFECRRRDARHFAECWAKGHQLDQPPKAGAMDIVLHAERLDGRRKRHNSAPPETLPDGAMVEYEGHYYAMRQGKLRPWGATGYGDVAGFPHHPVNVLTPAAIIKILRAGYNPVWYPDIT